jgi:hypothetical protein
MALDKKILSVDSDDDNENYEIFSQFLDEETKRNKNRTAIEIDEFGKQYLNEIEKRRLKKEIQKGKYIHYIYKHTKSIYPAGVLESYSFEDVKDIYNEVKIQKRPAIVKFFYFLFDL